MVRNGARPLPNLIAMRFGSSDASRVAGFVDGVERVHRWLLDRISFPGARHVEIDYDADGPQRYLRRIRWSVFRLEFEYEPRPDPFSQCDTGFELRTTRRCKRIALHQDRLAPETLMRTYSLDYQAAARVGLSLLVRVQVSGWRFEEGALRETALPSTTFGYTAFDPTARRIQKLASNSAPPPPLGEDVTLLDFRGSALPGVLRMDGNEATYWENRGQLLWGPPERLRTLPQGLRLGDSTVRFADLTGNGTADLVVATHAGGGYFPNDPEQGFLPRRRASLAPDFDICEEDSWLLDLDGDRVADLLTFRNGVPMVFFNDRGESWSGPVVLPSEGLPNFTQRQSRLRFADMNGDGNTDMVLLQSRQVVYWPYLGNGRWGGPRTMAQTPEFALPRPDDEAHLADLDGDGTADLILVGNDTVRIYLNSGGEFFSEPIELHRTPRLRPGEFLVTDMTGSGTAGFLWTRESGGALPHGYWFLDLLNGIKPYLLTSIDNACGLTTTIDYTTSARERAIDLAEGRRWSGYLPFVVHVVKQLTNVDSVTSQQSATRFRYHEGHYDGRAREYLGFGCVDSVRLETANEAAVHQRFYFHNRGTTADDPAFIAGKGQPHRTEVLNPTTGEIRQIEEAIWAARLVPTASVDRPAYLAVHTERTSRRLQASAVYEQEQIAFHHDDVGNVVLERRKGEWTDSGGAPHVDHLSIETSYASHATLGLTTYPSQVSKRDDSGRLLKAFSIFYDGPAFVGLPLGVVERGWKTRQTEAAVTATDVSHIYPHVEPALLNSLYRAETDAAGAGILVNDTQRYRLDAFGNQIETLDALGRHVAITFDGEGIHPLSVREDDGPVREMTFDPIAQQVARLEDANGHVLETRYDGLGNVVAVFRHGGYPDHPTETYEFRRNETPNCVVQRQRLHHDDVEPGLVKYEYRDGLGRVAQVRTLAEGGRWAVGKQQIRSLSNQLILERDAYFSPASAFATSPPPGTAERQLFYDFAARLVKEQLFSGHRTHYTYADNETRFYGPDRMAPDLDPTATPTRVSRTDAWGRIVSIEEADEHGSYDQRRDYDALGHLVRITDPLGYIALATAFDLRDNRIQVLSAESGLNTFLFDGDGHEVLRIDADGRALHRKRDHRGRIVEVRNGGPHGVIEETYSYDLGDGENLHDRLATVSGTFGEAEYSYSPEGDPVRIRRTFADDPATYEIRFGYNNQRKVTFVEYPDNTRVDYQYHPTGLLASIPGFIEAIEYGSTGKRERIVFSNGLATRHSYTPGDYLLREIVTEPVGGGPRYQHLVHHLDAIGQVTQIDDLSSVSGKVRNNQTFAYDPRNRLSRATGTGASGPYDVTYQYDELGNMVFSGEGFAEAMDYGHSLGDATHPNRLIKRHAAPSPEYLYDASGNLIHDPALGDLTFDTRHRLVRVTQSGGTVIEYQYDHNDRMVRSRVTKDGTTATRYEVENLYSADSSGTTKVIFDGTRKLAVVPQSGDTLLHHPDRLGNVNVVTNLSTGAFVGHDEYMPYGRLSVSMVITPHFSFQGARLNDGIDVFLLGARHYRPMLGRFLSPDMFLVVNQEKIPGLLMATNLYVYAYASPSNFTDPTGRIAPLVVVVIVAAIVGAIVGAVGAAVNGAQTWEEWLLWIIGGAIGAVLVTLFAGIGGWQAAIWALSLHMSLSLIGTATTRVLDATDSPAAWFFSFLLKWMQSPVLTTFGLTAALAMTIGRGYLQAELRRGTLFIDSSLGVPAVTLGGVVWSKDYFKKTGAEREKLAQHEAYHSRSYAALGEVGFAFTYWTVGGIWGQERAGLYGNAWQLNPFEDTAPEFGSEAATPS